MADGNACWKQEKGDSLFDPQEPLSRFTVRYHKDYDKYQFKPDKSLMTRVNGEMCAFNTIEIIKRYNPKYYVIENPAHGRLWEYIDKILGFEIPFDNLTYYNNYDYPIKKPTKFKSNIDLKLKKELIENEVEFRKLDRKGGAYNQRSNIPGRLVEDIFTKILTHFKED